MAAGGRRPSTGCGSVGHCTGDKREPLQERPPGATKRGADELPRIFHTRKNELERVSLQIH